jgi:hypothetical protein
VHIISHGELLRLPNLWRKLLDNSSTSEGIVEAHNFMTSSPPLLISRIVDCLAFSFLQSTHFQYYHSTRRCHSNSQKITFSLRHPHSRYPNLTTSYNSSPTILKYNRKYGDQSSGSSNHRIQKVTRGLHTQSKVQEGSPCTLRRCTPRRECTIEPEL